MSKRNDLLAGWEELQDKIPSNHADAAEALWDYGDLLVDQLLRDSERIRKLREALITIRDKRNACYRAADCQAVAREALRSTEASHDD